MTSPHLSERAKDLIKHPTKVFAISDVHLKKMASPTGEAVLSLVRCAQKECGLFIILGDLFDLWLGQGDYFVREYSPLIQEIRKLKETCRVVYFEGNHDLHLKKFWQEQLGVEVFTSPQLIEFNGMKIWAEHGDEINRKDRDYLFLRWFLRTKPLEFLVYNLPSAISNWIGKQASGLSRAYTQRLDNHSIEIVRAYAQKISQKEKFDLCLVGHTHMTDDFTFDGRRLINLGTWLDKPCYLQVDSSLQQIKVLPI